MDAAQQQPQQTPRSPPAARGEDPVAAALRRAGGVALPHGVSLRGWRVTCTHTPIMGRDELRRAEAEVGSRLLPEMCFGGALELSHERSGCGLRFCAVDALRDWAASPLPPLRVAAAAVWSAAHERRLQEGSIRGWAASAVAPTDGPPAEWTFTTPFGGTVLCGGAGAGAGAAAARWVATGERIDRGALAARDPIVFYDELTLYESELDDNGTTSLTVRVMPSCWFVLLRYFLRVDGVLLRLRETRLFCATGGDAAGGGGAAVVLRERCFREETFESLRARGAPSIPAAFPHADAAAAVLRAPEGADDVTYERLDLAAGTGG